MNKYQYKKASGWYKRRLIEMQWHFNHYLKRWSGFTSEWGVICLLNACLQGAEQYPRSPYHFIEMVDQLLANGLTAQQILEIEPGQWHLWHWYTVPLGDMK